MQGKIWCAVAAIFLLAPCAYARTDTGLQLSAHNTLEEQGLSVLIYQSKFHPVFRDQKISGIEIIQHDDRIATDGEVRLGPTPEQWDPVPTLAGLKRGPVPNQVIVSSGYPDRHLAYHLVVTAEPGGFRVAVNLDKPLPADLVGKAGFSLDFLPTAYYGKSYILNDGTGVFPRHPHGQMKIGADGKTAPTPMAQGKSIVLAPGDPLTRVSIVSDKGPLMLYDGRETAQNGWFEVRTLIAAGAAKNAVVWHIHPNVIPGWTRKPVVSFNQVGYTPDRAKVAIVELDPLYKAPKEASLLRLGADGKYTPVFKAPIKPWGKWLRYDYAAFDFSSVKQPGIYAIAYAGHRFDPFRIAKNVYKGIWHPSLDGYLAEQMDHIKVREVYRVWHGPSHMDDARQAPPNTVHFDGYAMGPNTDSPFKPGQHIPGLNVGGWTDAGDFDIRTESQTEVVRDLAMTWEDFHHPAWDNLSVDEAARKVDMLKPDGVPDLIEQIKHGVLQLMAQYKVFGHAIPGIIAPTLHQYTFIGDDGSKTDRMIYSPKMTPLENNGVYSGVPDDRWAFTTHTTPLNYDAVSALAAASRSLKGYDDNLAKQCLETAIHVWDQEQKSKPVIMHTFNTGGGDLLSEESLAAIELVIATKGAAPYKARLQALLPYISKHFIFLGWEAARAIPYMDAPYRATLATDVKAFKGMVDAMLAKNPYHVPITTGTWAGSAAVSGFATGMYTLHQAFPRIIGTNYTLNAIDYLLGRHPASNLSLVSTVGTRSKLVGYGHNRADYSFIQGGVVPGVLIVPPDFPELKEHWPYLWYENEYVIGDAASFILAANAAQAVTAQAH